MRVWTRVWTRSNAASFSLISKLTRASSPTRATIFRCEAIFLCDARPVISGCVQNVWLHLGAASLPEGGCLYSLLCWDATRREECAAHFRTVIDVSFVKFFGFSSLGVKFGRSSMQCELF